MARIKLEVTLSDADREFLKRAAEAAKLPLATWAKSQLMLAADTPREDCRDGGK